MVQVRNAAPVKNYSIKSAGCQDFFPETLLSNSDSDKHKQADQADDQTGGQTCRAVGKLNRVAALRQQNG